MNRKRLLQYGKLLLAIVLAVGFLYLVFRKLDWAQFWRTIAGVRVGWLLAANVPLRLNTNSTPYPDAAGVPPALRKD
jgi:hypothetical protein